MQTAGRPILFFKKCTELRSFIRLFPADAQFLTSHMPICCKLTVDWLSQIQTADNSRRTQIKHRLHRIGNLLIRIFSGSIGLHHHRHGARHSNGISQFDFAPLRQTCGYNVFGCPPRRIGCAPIYLGRILSAESTAAMTGISAVGINNDLPSGQSAVPLGASYDKSPGRIDLNFSCGIH